MCALVKFILVIALALTASGQQPVLRWGGDSEGGAPFVVHVAFASIDQSVQRGDFDIGLSGVEDTPARRAALAASIPYYEFTETLTVREADKDKFKSLDD